MKKSAPLTPLLILALLTVFCGMALFSRPTDGLRPFAFAMGSSGQDFHAGVRSLGLWDESTLERLEIAVWYPCRKSGGATLQDWRLPAALNAAPVAGRYPVIIISHDMGGHRFFNNDLAAALARQGFVVIAPNHTGDSLNDGNSMFAVDSLYRRPRQLALSLSAVLSSDILGPITDKSRVGVLGVGSGAATALQLAGVDPDPAGLKNYCATAGSDDVFCSPWASGQLKFWPEKMAATREDDDLGPHAFIPRLRPEAPPVVDPEQEPHFMGPPREVPLNSTDLPPPQPYADKEEAAREPRLRAIGLMAPGWMMLFNETNLAALRVPAGVLIAGADEVYKPAMHGGYIWKLLPSPPCDPSDMLVIAGADHYSLNAPCPQDLAATLPGLCGRATDKQRQDWAFRRDNYFIKFFKAYLGEPLPPYEPPEGREAGNA